MEKKIKMFLEHLGSSYYFPIGNKIKIREYISVYLLWFGKQFFVFLSVIAVIECFWIVNSGIGFFEISLGIPFSFFVIAYIFGYVITEFFIFGFRYVGRYNILFHFGFFLFGLNFVGLLTQYHLFYTTPFIYVSIGFIYIVIFFFGGIFGIRVYYYCVGFFIFYFIFYFFYIFDAFLIFSNVVIYKTVRRTKWIRIKYPHIALYSSFWPAKHNVSLVYRNFSDTNFFWDYSIWAQIFFNICMTLLIFFFFSTLYSRLVFYIVRPYFTLYFIYLGFGMTLLFLVVYLIFGLMGSINFFTFQSPIKSVYPFIISFMDQLDYKTYLMFAGYVIIIATLLRVGLAGFRWLVLTIIDRPFIIDIDYKSMVRAIYYRKHPMFWKFPRRWFKLARFGKKRKINRSRHVPLPEDAVFYYGGPNPHMVLFNGVTGEVKPIFIKDLVAENYRVYYKFYNFELRKSPISRFWKFEIYWSLSFIFDDDVEEDKEALIRISKNIGLFSFYSKNYARTELLVERWRRIMNPEQFRRDDAELEKEFFDTHMWESVWYRDFGRKTLSGYTESSTASFSYEWASISGFRTKPWFRPTVEGREHIYELALIHRQQLSQRVTQINKNIGVLTNLCGNLYHRQSHSTIGMSQRDLNSFTITNLAIINFFNEFILKKFKDDSSIQYDTLQQKILLSVRKSKNWFIEKKPQISRRRVRIRLEDRIYRMTDAPRISTVIKLLINFSVFDFIRTGFSKYLYNYILTLSKTKNIVSADDNFIFNIIFDTVKYRYGLVTAFRAISNQNFQSFFFSKLLRFGFFGLNKQLRIDGVTEKTSLSITTWADFSLFSALESTLVSVFSNFPLYNYLSRWQIEFSGFFEFPNYEKFYRLDRGRFGRFKIVNPKILLDNETSPKINYFFINFKYWGYENKAPRVKYSSKFKYFKHYTNLSRFLISDYLISKYFSNLCLLTTFLNNFSSGYLASFNEHFLKTTLLMERPLLTAPLLPYNYVPSRAVYQFGDLPFGLVDYHFFFNFDNAFFNVRKTISRRTGVLGFEIPISYMFTTADSNYLDFYIFNNFYSQILFKIPVGFYFNKFSYGKFRKYRFKFPAFYPAFESGANDNSFLQKSVQPSIFARLRFNYGSVVLSSVFSKNRILCSLQATTTYNIVYEKSQISWYTYFYKYLVYRKFCTMKHIFSMSQFTNYFFVKRDTKNKLNLKFYNFGLMGSTPRRNSRINWIYNWNIKFFYPTGKKSRISYYSLRFQSRMHNSFVDRVHISFFRGTTVGFSDVKFYSSLGPVSEFLFNFIISSQSKSIYYFWFKL